MKKIIAVEFYKSGNGQEPVRAWLDTLERADKYHVGTKLLEVEIGWPLGMPLVRKMKTGLWEVRITLPLGRIARVLFTVSHDRMVLLHGFIKKSQKTPATDLHTAEERHKLHSSKHKR